MMYQNVLFDLDGTLSDPGPEEIESVIYSLKYFGILKPSRGILEYFVGPPLKESFKKFCNMSDDEISIAIGKYREYFLAEGINKNNIYEGIKELLEDLYNNKINTYVVTSNPTQFAEKMLEIIGVKELFTGVYGSNMDGSLVDKAEIIKLLFEENPQLNKSNSVMVGDRKYDVIGAHSNGIDAISVLYGFGTLNEVAPYSPEYVVDSVANLRPLLFK